MCEEVVYDMYSDDRKFRYEVFKLPNGLYRVCLQSKEADDYSEHEQYLYCDISEQVTRFADTLERAIEIGDDKLYGLTA